MKLEAKTRNIGKIGELRREGNIPAVLYGKKQESQAIVVKKEDFQTILRELPKGLLATTVFELHLGGKTVKALVKDIQYHVTSYEIQHIDFLLLNESEAVQVNVPVQMTGVADCIGVKGGGFLRLVVRTVPVKCLPRYIPKEVNVDVKDLDVGGKVTLGGLTLSPHVQLLAKDMKGVVVSVGKKAGA